MRTEDWEDVEQRLDRVAPRNPVIQPNSIGSFVVRYNDTTRGLTASFLIVNKSGMSSVQLKRNFSLDPGSARILQSWDVNGITEGQTLQYDDNDPDLRSNQNVYYWLDAIAFQNAEAMVTVGPQTFANNADTLAPDAISDFDVSHEALAGGVIQISASFSPPTNDRFGSCKIYVTGYNGITASQLLAQNATSPWRFPMLQTGETVTFAAVATSLSGIEATTWPTKNLTLGSAATVPAKIMGATAAELSTGVQVTFPAGAESNITQYAIYRAVKGAGFGAAVSLGTVAPSGAFRYTFLDTTGLVGGSTYEWYVFAQNAIGNGSASAAINTIQFNTSADFPSNSPANNTNTATVDSIDNGTNATIRVYGPGGVGTGYTRKTGFGDQSRTTSTITGAYTTTYYVYRANGGGALSISTLGYDTIPDQLEFVGKVTTVAAGGGGGSSGGGGAGGGGGGKLIP